MSLSPVAVEILETMFLKGNPMEATQITLDDNKEVSFTTIMLHLVELIRRGYVNSPQKDLYRLTDEGKKVIGIQPTTKENAKTIMAYAAHDKAFNFYVDTDKPLHIHAHSLQDFANKLSRADVKSIEFHMNKDEFEAWFRCLGDKELTKKVAIIKKRKIMGEQLRLLLHNIVEQRCQELMRLT
jgi:Mn-dependent DtxR family transcriptional regulator